MIPRSLSHCRDLDGHLLAISLTRLHFLASLCDGSEDGIVVEGVVLGDDFGGLFLEADIVSLNS